MEIDTEQRIIQQASHLFLQFGVRNVTLDELAQQIGISKKTIYQHFSNKADMIFQVAKSFLKQEEAVSEKICQEAPNAIVELLGLLNWTLKTIHSLSTTLISDLKKYYPTSWQLIEDFLTGYVYQKVRDNLAKGIQEGLFRPDLEQEIVARFRIAQLYASIDPQLFPADQFQLPYVQEQLLDLYVHSVATPAGLLIYRQQLPSFLNDVPSH